MSVYSMGKDKYQIDLIIGYYSNGKRKRHFETFYGPKKAAVAREAKLKAELKDGTFIINNGFTFEEFSEKWMKEYARPILAPKTIAEYERLLSIINPKIGHYKLINIKPLILIELYNSLRNRPNKKKLSETSILRYYALINAVLNKAVKWDLLRVNPNEKIDKPKREKKEAKCYDFDQTKELLRVISNENIRDRTFIALAVDTGARRGELTGLEWEDIDFDKRIIDINKTTQAGRGIGVIEKKPKNNTSIRNNVIKPDTIILLKKLKDEQAENKKAFGSKWQNSKKVFTTVDGRTLHPDRPSQIFRQIIKKYDLEPIPLHGLRHTLVSLMLSNGTSVEVVSKRVGHSTSATTLNIYSHVFESSDREAVDKLDAMLK